MPLDGNVAFAMDLLHTARHNIEGAVHVLPSMRKRMNGYLKNDPAEAKAYYLLMEKEKERLMTTFESARLALLELDMDALAQYTAKLRAAVGDFNLMTKDYAKICGILTEYVGKLPADDNTVNAATIGRLMNNIRLGYYPTDLDHIELITGAIRFPAGMTTNLLDPCCGCGLALRLLAEGNNCFTYGVELDESRAEEAQGRLHRVGIGSFYHSRISHDAFHAMLLNPPYLSVLGPNDKRTREEKKFLTESYRHVIPGGLLIYIIPYYRLTADIARVLCDNFEDLTIWRFRESEFKKFKQVVILGTRRKRSDGSALVQVLLETAVWADNIPSIDSLPAERYSLPDTETSVEIFKGERFNVQELAQQLRHSNSLTRLCEASELESRERRPLLPLNISQVGLIGGSGLINGLVECDNPHVIKGRVVKQSRKRQDAIENIRGDVVGTEYHETVSNRMIFNILTPKGIKTLT
ncbi:class I SAM-dependent methyltransferase [Oscillospiraceae bacterium OttesenSCG-928-F05]|nr:class I SAM-dependent methyltransferase [Oscillospiraceae bacterium OttesenSCG-928-F05]